MKQSQQTKLFLEIYGIFCIALGVGQIIGLLANVFLKELVIRYPEQYGFRVMDKEMLALSMLAVVMRGAFHIVRGLGLARLQAYGRYWTVYGWPVMVFISWGLWSGYYADWAHAGYVSSIGEVVSLGGAFVFLAWIVADYFLVGPSARVFIDKPQALDEAGGRLGGQKISIILFVIVLVLSVVMFSGRSIRSGFHKTFIKRGETTQEEGRAARAFKKPDPDTSALAVNSPREGESLQKKEEQAPLKEISTFVDRKRTDPEGVITPEDIKRPAPSGAPYKDWVGYGGSACILLALMLCVYRAMTEQRDVSFIAPVLLAMGFLSWFIYAMAAALWPLMAGTALASGLCAVWSYGAVKSRKT